MQSHIYDYALMFMIMAIISTHPCNIIQTKHYHTQCNNGLRFVIRTPHTEIGRGRENERDATACSTHSNTSSYILRYTSICYVSTTTSRTQNSLSLAFSLSLFLGDSWFSANAGRARFFVCQLVCLKFSIVAFTAIFSNLSYWSTCLQLIRFVHMSATFSPGSVSFYYVCLCVIFTLFCTISLFPCVCSL